MASIGGAAAGFAIAGPINGPIMAAIGGMAGGILDQLWMPKLFGEPKQPQRAVDIDMSLATDGTQGTIVYGLMNRIPLHLVWTSLPWAVDAPIKVNKRQTQQVTSWYAQAMWVAAQRPTFEFDQLIFDGRRVYTATIQNDLTFTARSVGSTTAGGTVEWVLGGAPANFLNFIRITNTRDGSGDPVDTAFARSLSEFDVGGIARLVLSSLYYSGGASPDPGGADDWTVVESRVIDAAGNAVLRIQPPTRPFSPTIPAHWTSLFSSNVVVDGTSVKVDADNVQFDPKVFPNGSASVEFKPAGTTKSTILSDALGATETPIHRSRAYVVTNAINLSSYGNRMPNAAAIVRSATNKLYLNDIVEDICETWAKLGAEEFDTDLVSTNSIYGLTVYTPFQPAEIIDSLSAAYGILWQEGGDSTDRAFGRFIHRDARDEAALDFWALNSRRPSDEFLEEPVSRSRIDMSERTRRVEVAFRNYDDRWQQGTESDEIEFGNGPGAKGVRLGKEVRVNFGELTMTRAIAKSIARELMRESWARTWNVSWTANYLHAHVQEDDIVSYTDDNGYEWVVVVERVDMSPDWFVEVQGYAIPREEIGATLTSEGSTDGGDPVFDSREPKSPVAYSPVQFEVFEVPPILDAHVGQPGVYVAITNSDPSVAFEGAAVFIQRPDDATWYLSGFVSQRATVGYTTDALATVADPTVFDATNDVNIQLYSEASLSTVTAAEVEIGRNLALIGTEVVGFRDAVLESDGTYTLDYLWRGAMATEDTVGDHVAFERFVVLDSNVGFVPINREDEGTVLSIKVVPPGATTDDVPTISHTVTLATCKPLPPADVTLTAVGNTLKADWTYRSLRAARFRDPTYAPREPGERIAIRYYNTTLASATTAVEEVEVDAALETYTLPTPYDAGLTASDISAEVVVVSDTFGESVAPGDDLGSAAFVTIAPVEYAEIDYVDGTSQAASSGPVTVAATDKVVPIDATSGAITVNLPPAASAKRLVTIVKVDSSVNLVTIDADGSETIDGATTRTLSTQWASVNLISDGTEWFTA